MEIVSQERGAVPDAEAVLGGIRRLSLLADHAEDPESIFKALAGELLSMLETDEVQVHHISPAGADPELVIVYMFDGEGSLTYRLPRSERAPGVSWVANTGRSFLAANPRELEASLPRLAIMGGVRSAALLPLTVSGEVRVVVVLVRHDGEVFDDAAIGLAGTLVGQAATALALLHARAEAGTDPLTGCMNRRAMHQRLKEEIGRAYRTESPLACLLADLDNFKAVNDDYGHPAGDKVLQEVAQALMGEFRAFDRVARYGGDEFVVILPNADLDKATAAAQRALVRLQALPSFGDGDTGVGASIGVAQWRTPMTAEELLQACDEALLRSKRDGKGRITRVG
ncbi:MAG TPA: GGDEF domain-containing protein [Solirubrobacteraceae bacterium]